MNLEFHREALAAVEELPRADYFLLAVLKRKLYLGKEQREGWTGALPFYLFWCKFCGHYAKDYPHGWTENRYLMCSYCDARHDFTPWWVPIAELASILRFAVRYRLFSKNQKRT